MFKHLAGGPLEAKSAFDFSILGIDFYVACRIGDAQPDDVNGAIWPYIAALMVGLVVIAAVAWISTVAL